MSDSLQPYGLEPARLLCPWDFPGKDTGVSSQVWGADSDINGNIYTTICKIDSHWEAVVWAQGAQPGAL